MKTVEQLKAEQAAQLAALEAQHAIASKLPGTPWYVTESRATGCPGASYKVKGLRGALELFRQFETVVPFAKVREGCLYLRPVECLPEKVRENAVGEFAVKLDVTQGFRGQFGPTVKMHFWARVENLGVIEITADIEGPGYIGAFHSLGCSYRMRGEQVERGSVRPNAALYGACQDTIRWAGSDDSAHYTYLIGADYQGEDNEIATLGHAPAILQNLADELDAS